MTILPTLISPSAYFDFPQGLVGWAGWLLLLGVLIALIWRWRFDTKPWTKTRIALAVALTVGVLVTSLFIGLRVNLGDTLTRPMMPEDTSGRAIMLFAALPWTLAAGLLGAVPAVALALLAGLLRALFDTHSFFTPLEMMLVAALFSAAMNQRYRTRIYRLLRHPLIAALGLTLVYPLFFLATAPFSASGLLASRLDYALSNLGQATLAMGVELLLAGSFAEVAALAWPAQWGRQGKLLPSPAERSLQSRFLYNMAPLAVVLVLFLVLGDWVVAGSAAREMLRQRMANAAEMAAKGIPYYLEAGQNLIMQLSGDTRLYDASPDQLTPILSQDIKIVPYFSQLYVLDKDGALRAGYPETGYPFEKAPLEEQTAISLALNGLPVQTYTLPPAQNALPAENPPAAQVSFIAAILDADKNVRGVLIGRSDLAANPFSQPVLVSLNNLAGVDGQGLLVDENNRILYHPQASQIMTTYSGRTADEPLFYDETGSTGTRMLVYFQRAEGRPWSVVLRVPAHRAQQLALTIAAPLLLILLLISVAAVVFLRLGLNMVTGSLKNLATESGRIAQGKLEQPLQVDGEDEVGQLRRAFEQMRVALKNRLDELNRLLLVSQGVASSLDIGQTVQPVLEAALATGANVARVVLTPHLLPVLDGDAIAPLVFGQGRNHEQYRSLDEQVLALTRQQDRLVLANTARPRLLAFPAGLPRPEALLAVALRHENLFYGTLWLGFDQPHPFSEEEVRFVATLAGQAALAAANSRLFMNAEIGRQRLAAILASSPDPVLVTDQHDLLLLANPAAWQALGLDIDSSEGQPVDSVLRQADLLELLRSTATERQSHEIVLPGGQVFLATATPVIAEGQQVGRVCVLRDVTHFKELDALKSEFVSTVSHDLRSPLTLMRGYATMLEMVGQLNEQQTLYVRKIVEGVESMSRLVNNLLDLGRIETGVGLQLEMVPVQDVVERVVGALQLQAAQKHIQMTTEMDLTAAPLIQADQALLQQALQNLVENAIKYTRPEGKVYVRVSSRGERMIFEVSDTGIGISPMDQSRLFERFYRGAQQSAREQRGSGLGLAIVKSIAERHAGEVWVESQLGKGSSFYLSLPLRQSEPETVAVKA